MKIGFWTIAGYIALAIGVLFFHYKYYQDALFVLTLGTIFFVAAVARIIADWWTRYRG